MSVLGRKVLLGAVVILIGYVFSSCEDDFNTIGSDVIANNNFEVNKAYFDVSASSNALKAVRTDGLLTYQLGRYNDPLYGSTTSSIVSQISLPGPDPVFGQERPENEAQEDVDDEMVTEVFMYIPFYGEDISEDGLGEEIPHEYRLDSIYGNQTIFKLKVEQSGFYLEEFDPNSQFQEPKEYFSNEDFSLHTQAVLFEGDVEINNKETLIFNEDDPATTDVNEAETVAQRIAPGIRVPLDPAFFQANIIDKEGSDELLNNGNFKSFLKGLYISTPDLQDHLLMLLNFNEASVTINYEYTAKDSENVITTEKESFVMSMGAFTAQGAQANTVVNTFVNESVDVSDASRLFIKGGEGSYAEITIDTSSDPEGIYQDIRDKKGLLNEANLKFYIDRTTLDNAGITIEPERLYTYAIESDGTVENDGIIDDYLADASPNISPLLPEPFYNYGGKIELGEDDKGMFYKIRITEHLKTAIEEEKEVRLAVTITSNINFTLTSNATTMSEVSVKIPNSSTINPLGTVLLGSDVAPEDEDRKLRLEVFYTKLNQ